MILDSTASKGRKWPQEADIRLDVNPEAKPDIVASACFLPFRAEVFEEIYCDPPHIGYPGKTTWAKNGIMARRFGFWKTWKEWHFFLERTNEEFLRCLTPQGLLKYKILDGAPTGNGTTKLKDLGRLTNFFLIVDTPEISKGINRRSMIHYLTFRKRGKIDLKAPQL